MDWNHPLIAHKTANPQKAVVKPKKRFMIAEIPKPVDINLAIFARSARNPLVSLPKA